MTIQLIYIPRVCKENTKNKNNKTQKTKNKNIHYCDLFLATSDYDIVWDLERGDNDWDFERGDAAMTAPMA